MAGADGYDSIRFIDETVPSEETAIGDVHIGSDVGVGETDFTHELSNVREGVQFRGAAWEHCNDVGFQPLDNSPISV